MKLKISKFLSTLCGLTLTSGSAFSATTIFTDTFGSGTGNWYQAGTVATVTNSSGQLSFTPSGADMRQVIGRSFTAQTLAVGQTIRVTLDYTQDNTATGNVFRIGIYDVQTPIVGNSWTTTGTLLGTYAGYNGFIRDNATGQGLRAESGTESNNIATGPTMSSTSFYNDAASPAFDILASTQYKAIFDLTYTSLTQMDVAMKLTSMDGLTTYYNVASSAAPVVYTSFDTVVLRSGNANPVLFDNIQVSIIPEPGAALLGSLGLLVMLRRRR